jgi:hypothetical protein
LNYTNTAKNISINTFFINAVSDRLAKWFHIEPSRTFHLNKWLATRIFAVLRLNTNCNTPDQGHHLKLGNFPVFLLVLAMHNILLSGARVAHYIRSPDQEFHQLSILIFNYLPNYPIELW